MSDFRFLLAALVLGAGCFTLATQAQPRTPALHLNAEEYLEMPGLNVMLAHDFYPEGHQGGVGIILNDRRIATNGDLRLEPTPGQWEPVPTVGKREVDRAKEEISVHMSFPDPEKNRKGFNPVIYPDLNFAYRLRVRPEGAAFRIQVDLETPLPEAWADKVSFNLELFPGELFGKSFYLDEQSGIFPRQPNGPGKIDERFRQAEDPFASGYQLDPLATGRRLAIAPESELQHLTIEAVRGGKLQLLDGRAQHNNGWFTVRATLERGATSGALEWLVTPHPLPNFKRDPVVQVSQVGYHPKQQKLAVIELDPFQSGDQPVRLIRVSNAGEAIVALEKPARDWGRFLRYRYLQFDFTAIEQPGIYYVTYGRARSATFQIGSHVYSRGVWQPTLEYFLPIQMCHMRVNDRYRVWHGWCHLDDARMAPLNLNHFDGYVQGASTLTSFKPGEHVPGLDRGGWHDAGDFDLRIESQAETVYGLALAYEAFAVDYDNTSIDQETRVVEIHQPDGKPDVLQQIEHGLLSMVGGYRSMGRLYRGIQTPTLRQYVLLGDAANMTDNIVYRPTGDTGGGGKLTSPAPAADDDWVFTEENPQHELQAAAALAAASRVLKNYNSALSADCLRIATELWRVTKEKDPIFRVAPAVELFLATNDSTYSDFLVSHIPLISEKFDRVGWVVGRTLGKIDQPAYQQALRTAARKYRTTLDELAGKTPFGVPYEPQIWGAGWQIQRFGFEQYFLFDAMPDVFSATYVLNALEFVLGRHPGSNTASFVSGVGAKSLIPGYGFNRADWSYIPGGSGSGTALIRPDFPELLEWPFLWQQTEYVLGGGTTDYLFLALAAEHLFKEKR